MKILIVEDSVPDAALIERELRKYFDALEVSRVETPEDFAVALAGVEWSVIITDHQLPRFSSTAALAALRDSHLDIPLIVVSGKMGEDFAVAAMRAGARDYLLKRDLARLGPVVARELRDAEVRRKLVASERERQRQQLEQELLSKRLEIIRRLGNDILLLIAPDGSISQANDRALQEYGYAQEEMLRLNLRDLRPPGTLADLDEKLQRALADDGLRYTTVHRRRDGSTFPVEVSTRLLEIGGKRFVQGFVRDLTDERAARAAVEYQAMLLDNLHDAVIGVDADGHINAWNRAAERMLGWSASETIGHSVDEFPPSEYADGATQSDMIAQVIRTGTLSSEVRRKTRTGASVDVESTAIVVRDTEGKILGFVTVNRDVSARNRAEAALRASQEKLQRILETANEGIWVFDAQGRTEFANARAAEMFGISSVKEMLGRTFVEALPENLRYLGDAEVSSFARGESAKRELKIPRPNGSDTLFVMSRSILRDPDGHMTGAVAFFMDVTDQHRAQEELQQSQKLEAVGRLASGIAHEINTPVQFIGDNTHFLKEAFTALLRIVHLSRSAVAAGTLQSAAGDLEREAQALDIDYLVEQAPRTIERTLDGVQRIATIVRAMKEFAHPDQSEMVATDLNRAILATLEIARNEYKYVAEVQTDLGALPPVFCCAGDVNQVFLNIVVNAAHAIADVVKGTQGRGTIRVTTRQEGLNVTIAISDTGCGIPETAREKIFEPFFTTKEIGRGTGQGLAIARKVVAKHRGQLTFTTAPGKGTTFFVRLPIEQTPIQAAPT